FAGGAGAAEAAFAVLVRRHGPAVLGVCRAVLRDGPAAEDAFQATFLVLATKAGRLRRPGPLGPWLCEVARRVARHARAADVRRRVGERAAAEARSRSADPPAPDVVEGVRAALGRLPECLRRPVVLCDLEGLSYHEAADRLGATHAAVRTRLARGRQRLRDVLRRLGLAPAAVAGPAAVSRALAASTARLAALVTAGAGDGLIPAPLLTLVNGGLQSMILTKLKTAGLTAVAVGVLVAGAFGLSAQTPAPTPAAKAPAERPSSTADLAAALTDYFVIADADPADYLARLAREARRRQEAGDLKGARQALRQLHAAAFDWEDKLVDDGPRHRTTPPASTPFGIPPPVATPAPVAQPAAAEPAQPGYHRSSQNRNTTP